MPVISIIVDVQPLHPHPRYLLRLVEMELLDRGRRTINRRICVTRFSAVKSFAAYVQRRDR